MKGTVTIDLEDYEILKWAKEMIEDFRVTSFPDRSELFAKPILISHKQLCKLLGIPKHYIDMANFEICKREF